MQDFTYLGSNITSDGEVKDEAKSRIGKAARAFGCLQQSIFKNCHLSVETKKKVYGAAVLSVLLYGAETWTAKAESIRRLSGFHNRCIRTIMVVSKYQQWREHIIKKASCCFIGMEDGMADIIILYSRNIVYSGLGTWPVWNHIECQSNYSSESFSRKGQVMEGHGSC